MIVLFAIVLLVWCAFFFLKARARAPLAKWLIHCVQCLLIPVLLVLALLAFTPAGAFAENYLPASVTDSSDDSSGTPHRSLNVEKVMTILHQQADALVGLKTDLENSSLTDPTASQNFIDREKDISTNVVVNPANPAGT